MKTRWCNKVLSFLFHSCSRFYFFSFPYNLQNEMPRIMMIIVIMIMLFIPLSYTQEDYKFSITTNRNFYENGDIIVISGNVRPIMQDVPIIIQIIAEGRLIDVAQITIAQDGSFSHMLIAEGPLWKKSGEYSIKTSYGTQSDESDFKFTSSEITSTVTDVFEVDAGKYDTFDVEYAITGGIIEYISVEPAIFGLAIGINSTDNGKLVVELPRQYIDSTDQKGADEVFIILIDDIQVAYTEDSPQNSHTRKISINFDQNDATIEVIGTKVILEFGILTAIILAVAMAVMMITVKSRVLSYSQY